MKIIHLQLSIVLIDQSETRKLIIYASLLCSSPLRKIKIFIPFLPLTRKKFVSLVSLKINTCALDYSCCSFSQMVDNSDESSSFGVYLDGNYRQILGTGILLLEVKIFDEGS